MDKNKITIIMGAYNVADTVGRAIDSLVAQTCDEWLLLICDDGSCDDTYGVIKSYEQRYPDKIHTYQNDKNHGLTYTLNFLVEKVQTEYIARMDADDVSIDDRLKKQMQFLDEHREYAFVGSSINKFDEGGIYCTCKMKEKPEKKDFLWNSPFVHPTIMIRTKSLREVGGYRDIPKTFRCEDYDLWFRLYEKGYKGFNINEVLLNYYEGQESFPKRKFIYRINEMRVRFEGYKRLNLFPIGIIYVIKPLLVGIIPIGVQKRIKKKSVCPIGDET